MSKRKWFVVAAVVLLMYLTIHPMTRPIIIFLLPFDRNIDDLVFFPVMLVLLFVFWPEIPKLFKKRFFKDD